MNMTTKVPATDILSPEEAQKLETLMDELLIKFQQNGCVLRMEWIIPILGNIPIIPLSPDMDARLDACDALAEYGQRTKFIEDFLMEKLA